jgi:hypothetical protein
MPEVVNFFTSGPVERSELFAEWTVNGTTAAAGCAELEADTVFVRAFPDQENVATVTATSACDAGSVRITGVPPGVRRHRVAVILYSGFMSVPPIPQQVTSTTVRDIVFLRGETSTVSVDLTPPSP